MADLNEFLKSLGIAKPQYENSPEDPLATDDAPMFKVPVEEDEPALEESDMAPAKPGPLASQADVTKMAQFPRSPAEERVAQEMKQAQVKDLPSLDLTEEPQQEAPSQLSRYQQLVKAYNDKNANLGMLAGANQIAQGFALGAGGKIGAGTEQLEMLKGMNQDPLKQLQGEDVATMMDPSSDVSKMYREQAYALLKKLNPEKDFSGALEKMSASQLQKLPGMKNILGGNGMDKAVGYGQFIDAKTGHPLHFDQATKTVMDSVTRQPINSDTVIARPIALQDAFGNRQFVSPQGNVTVQSSKRPVLSTEELSDQSSAFAPDKEQRQAFDKEKGRIDGLTKNVNEKLSAANRILSALDGDSKQAMAVIKTQMPRLAGEVGNLNQAEQEVWGGSQAWLDRAMQYLEKGTTSELTSQNKEELRKILGIFLDDAVKSRDSIMDASANSLAQVYNIPQDFTKSAYGVIKPLSARSESVAKGNYKEPSKITSNSKEIDRAKELLKSDKVSEATKQALKQKYGL